MKYKLIALDIDGTLLTTDKQLPQENIDAMRAAVEAGAHVMIATGRPYRAASWVLERAGIEGMILSVGGSLIQNYPSGETVLEYRLDPDFVRDFTNFCTEKNWFFHYIHGSDVYFTRECDESRMTEGYFGYPGHVVSLDTMQKQIFNKGNAIAHQKGTVREMAEELQRVLGHRAVIQVADSMVIDVTPLGVDKGESIRIAADKLGLTVDEVLAVGDADSDISMLKAAGLGVCLANGTEATLAAADYVAPSNDEFGVKHVIEKFVLEMD